MSKQEIVIWLKKKYTRIHNGIREHGMSDYYGAQLDLIDEMLTVFKDQSIDA